MIKQTILLALFASVCVMAAPTKNYDPRNEIADLESELKSLPKEIRVVFIKLHVEVEFSFNYLSSDMYKRMQDKLTADEAKEMRSLTESGEDVNYVGRPLGFRRRQFMKKLSQEARNTLFEEFIKLQEKGIAILKTTDYEKELSEVKKYKSKPFEDLSFEEKLYVLKYDLREVGKEIPEKINTLLAKEIEIWEKIVQHKKEEGIEIQFQ